MSTINGYFANSTSIGAGMPVTASNNKFYVDCGAGRVINVCKEAVGNDSLLNSTSLWPASGKSERTFGLRTADDTSVYVLIETSYALAAEQSVKAIVYPFAGTPVELEVGGVEKGRRFIYRLNPGDEVIYAGFGSALQGLRIEDGILKGFVLSPAQLVSLKGDDFRAVRQKAYENVFKGFANGSDAGSEAMEALLVARRNGELSQSLKTRFLQEIGPRLEGLATTYGWSVSMNGTQVVVVLHGISHTMYTTSDAGGPTRAQKEAKRAALRAERLKNRPEGVKGSKDNKFGKKEKKK